MISFCRLEKTQPTNTKIILNYNINYDQIKGKLVIFMFHDKFVFETKNSRANRLEKNMKCFTYL